MPMNAIRGKGKTDIHFGGSLYSIKKDTKALDAVYDLIEYTKPDLVIVTGDMTFPLGKWNEY